MKRVIDRKFPTNISLNDKFLNGPVAVSSDNVAAGMTVRDMCPKFNFGSGNVNLGVLAYSSSSEHAGVAQGSIQGFLGGWINLGQFNLSVPASGEAGDNLPIAIPYSDYRIVFTTKTYCSVVLTAASSGA